MTNEAKHIEKELFRLIALGDENAFSACVHRFTPQLFPYIKSIVQTDFWAEDLLQDLFTKLWQNRAKLDAVQNPGAYLNRMAANMGLDFIRHNAVEVKAQYRIMRQLETSNNNPAGENYDRRLYENLLRGAINKLTPQQMRVFRLRYEEHLSYLEIAGQMDISRHTVRNHLITAAEIVRTYLKKHIDIILLFICFLKSL